jgi:hypothetical protein
MSRFQDSTTSWFMVGDDPEQLSGTIQIDLPEEQPRWKSWPAILAGAAALSALTVGVMLLFGHRASASTAAPPPLQIAVARSIAPPPAPEPEIAPVATPAPAPEPEIAPVAAPAPEKKIIVAKKSKPHRAHKRAKLAPPSRGVRDGEKLYKQKKYGAALEQFQQQLRFEPDDVRALRGACLSLDQLGRRNDAARVCRRALTIEPTDVATRAALARIYYTGGAYQWSANEWRRVLAARPGDLIAKRGLRAAEERL